MIRILLGLALSLVVCAGIASCNKKEEAAPMTPPAADENAGENVTE